MSDYIVITDYAAKDAMLTGNPSKLVKGTEIGADFDAVAVAVATKFDSTDLGVTVQPYDADLTTWAGVTPGTGVATALAVNVGSAGAPVVNGGALGTPSSGTLTSCTGLPAAGVTGTALVSAAIGTTVLGYVAPGTSGNVLTSNGSAWTSATPSVSGNEQALTGYYLPAAGSAYQDCYRAGFLPSWFNQQWGGAQWGMLPDGSFGSVATGNVQDDIYGGVGDAAGNYYRSTGFKVSETATFDAAWVKIYKVGNPTGNLTARIYTDTAGSPNAATGSAATISCKIITSKTDGEWYQITGLAAALTAGTQYHLVLTLSTTDASNYVVWKGTVSSKYPHGYRNIGTSAPVWTPTTTYAMCFLIQNPAANSTIQSGGMFDYKLAFNNGSPVNQSRSMAAPLVNFYDGKSCSVLYRGTYAASSNVWDFCYGLDHDRITLTINSSGYPVLTIYESDRTVATVTAAGSVTSGSHDVGIRVRTVGDGADYATLYVDGASVGTPLTSQTFTMDAAMPRLGTARLGDGFGLAPTWTQDMQMTALPSAQGWTWTGTGTEANCMSIQNNKLYQNANGYTSTQTGYYTKSGLAFANGTGSTVVAKLRVVNSTNSITTTIGSTPVFLQLQDGSKDVKVSIEEYFLRTGSGSTTDFTVQGDFKSQDHVFVLQGKGSDYYLFMDGKLLVDGTGKLVTATATNAIYFGDGSATASDNADAIWSYVKYYQGGMLLPTAGSNTCSEFAHWTGDKSSLYATLWNSGTPLSVKQVCGVPRNYQFEQVVQREVRRGVTSAPTTTSTTPVLLTDMEAYVIGSTVATSFGESVTMSVADYPSTVGVLDGISDSGSLRKTLSPSVGTYVTVAAEASYSVPLGLHKAESRWYVGSGTATNLATMRNLTVEARS